VAKLAASGVLSKDFSFSKDSNDGHVFSGLTLEQVRKVSVDYAIYIADTGRMSFAGVSEYNIDTLVKASKSRWL